MASCYTPPTPFHRPILRPWRAALHSALAAAFLLAWLVTCAPSTHTTGARVVEIDADASHLTVDHDEIPGLMPAMRMRLAIGDPALLAGVAPGSAVRLRLAERAGALVVTDLQVVDGPARPRPGVHDHTPHHGGVVTMVGLRHLEAVARRDGELRVYVTDVWRRPVPLEGWRGEATVGRGGPRRRIVLAPDGDALAGRGPAPEGGALPVHLRVRPPGDEPPLDAHLTLAVAAGATAAAVAPQVQCGRGGAASAAPRCTLAFGEPVTAVAAVPERAVVALAIQDAGVSLWRLDDGALVGSFAPPPAIAAPGPAVPHAEIVDALALAPDGRQAMVASEGRLLRYATGSGRLLRVLAAPAPLLRRLAWLPDGASVAVQPAYGPVAWRVAAADGALAARLEAGAPVTALAVDGARLLLGTDRGEVLAVDSTGGAARVLATVARPVRALEAAGGRIVVATGAGTLEILDGAGRRLAASAPASPCHRVAASAALGLVACAAFDHGVRLHDLASARPLADLVRHDALVQDLAFAGSTLVTGDAAGLVAFWDAGGRRP